MRREVRFIIVLSGVVWLGIALPARALEGDSPDHTLWLSYGSYIGVVELVQLDPATGLRIKPDSRIYRLSARSEASAVIYRDKHYDLFVNRGSCCVGQNSTYHIQVGRSEQVTGPYRDRDGVDMLEGGGATFMETSGNKIGPGHFGLLSENGVDRFSYHLEYDGDHPGRSVLDIRLLLFNADGWPKPGAEAVDGTYQIVCKGTGDVVQAGDGANRDRDELGLGHSSGADNQKWTLTAVGVNQFKIIGVAGGKAMEVAGASRESGAHIGAAAYAAAENQIWRIEQLSDGAYRIASVKSGLALTCSAKHTEPENPLEQTTFKADDNQKWLLKGTVMSLQRDIRSGVH